MVQGTAMPQATELMEVYNLPVMAIPPNAASSRKDHGPKMFFVKERFVLKQKQGTREYVGPSAANAHGSLVKSGDFYWMRMKEDQSRHVAVLLEQTKYGQVVDQIYKSYVRGQPVLVGTSTVEESSEIHKLLLDCKSYIMDKAAYVDVFDKQHVRILNATPELAAREASIIAEVMCYS